MSYSDNEIFTQQWNSHQCILGKYLPYRAAFFVEGVIEGECKNPFTLDAETTIDLVAYYPADDISKDASIVSFTAIAPYPLIDGRYNQLFNRFNAPQMVVVDLKTNQVKVTGRFKYIHHIGRGRLRFYMDIAAVNFNYTKFVAQVTGQDFANCYAIPEWAADEKKEAASATSPVPSDKRAS